MEHRIVRNEPSKKVCMHCPCCDNEVVFENLIVPQGKTFIFSLENIESKADEKIIFVCDCGAKFSLGLK